MTLQRSVQEGRPTRSMVPAVVVAAALGLAAPAVAFDLPAEPHAFGMVGLAQDQRAILSAVQTQPPDPTRGVCRVTLSFVDALGQTFRDSAGNEVKQTFSLRDNVAVQLRLNPRDVLSDTERRKAIRPVTEVHDVCPCVGVVASWEIVTPPGATTATGQLGYRAPGPPDPPCLSTPR